MHKAGKTIVPENEDLNWLCPLWEDGSAGAQASTAENTAKAV